MILALLYHRIGDGKYANSLNMMQDHFRHIAKNYHVVLPGDPLQWWRVNVCLTFDDATYDFYHYVFPLLKKFNLRAVLAVPVHFILDSSQLDPNLRLSVPYSKAMKGDDYRTHCPFCTWDELREMAQSNLVEIASHSFHHQNLLIPGINLDHEIIESKRLLEQKLSSPIRTFVYPLGKFNQAIHEKVKSHYQFAMRIGTAWNWNWQNSSGIIYRVICDNMNTPKEHFRFLKKLNYAWFYLLNSIRGR